MTMTNLPMHPHWPASDLFPMKIAGAHFYRENIAQIAKNKIGSNALVFSTAFLIPEPTNLHDPNAVRVEIESKVVGHLSRDHALQIRECLAANDLSVRVSSCNAVISGGV